MEESNDFTIYPFCHPSEFFDIYQRIYGDENRIKIIDPPLEFLRSQHATPLSAIISVSLHNLKKQIHRALKQETNIQKQIQQPQLINWGDEFLDLPTININEKDLFVTEVEQTNIQVVHLLKSAGMDILRFISQLTDMYNDKEFTNKNKSLSSLLGQDRLQMQEADILTEMRHSLTHKQFPSIQSIVSAIDYLLVYLKDQFWDKLLDELKSYDSKRQQSQIIKSIRKQVKSRTLSKKDFILYGRKYVKDQLQDLYKVKESVYDSKLDMFTKMVKQLCTTHFHSEHLLTYLFSKIIKQAGFIVNEQTQDYSQFIQNRLDRQRKLIITKQYILNLFQDQSQKKPNIFKTTITPVSRRINIQLQRMQNIACINDEVKQLLENLKTLVQIKVEYLPLNILSQTEIDEVSHESNKYLKDVVIRPNSILFGSNFHAYLDRNVIE